MTQAPDFRTVPGTRQPLEQTRANIAAVSDLTSRIIHMPEDVRSMPNTSKPSDITQETIDEYQADITRAITTSTGFTPYILEKPAKQIWPVEAPLLKLTPRVMGLGGPIEHWIAVTSVFNSGGPFSLAHLGATGDGSTTIDQPTYVLANYQNTYQTIALYNSVTFQAQWRGRALEGDLLARRRMELLYALKLVEEMWLISGSSKLWSPAAPLLSTATTGGSIAAATNWIQVTAVNANGETTPSAAAKVVTTGTTSTITLTFSGVPFATSYNVYAGTGASQPANGAMWKQSATVSQPTDPMSMSVTVTLTAALATSGTNPPASNTATTVLIGGASSMFDGAQSLCYLNPSTLSGASVGEQGEGAVIIQPAASTGLLALSDIQMLFRKQYSYARARPEYLFCSPIEAVTIDNLVGTSSNYRVVVDGAQPNSVGKVVAGQKVTTILNQTTGDEVKVITLPYLPQGTIMAGSFSIPWPMPGLDMAPFRLMVNQDYYSLDYPPSQSNPQTFGFGDFVDETLVNQYIGGWALLNGIQPAAGV